MIGNLLRLWIMQTCECCGNDCDCGCVLDCPLHKREFTDHGNGSQA